MNDLLTSFESVYQTRGLPVVRDLCSYESLFPSQSFYVYQSSSPLKISTSLSNICYALIVALILGTRTCTPQLRDVSSDIEIYNDPLHIWDTLLLLLLLVTWHFVVVTDTEDSVHRHARMVVENLCGFSWSCVCRGRSSFKGGVVNFPTPRTSSGL